MFRHIVIACALCALCALLPVAARAAGTVSTTAWGPRLGVSSGPDQFVVGGQFEIAEIAPSLSFDPSVEVGFGDSQTRLGLNFDMHYHFRTNTTWKPYAGAGATLDVVHFDDDHRDSETDAGMGVILGATAPTKSGNAFFAELNLGLGDIPDLRFMVGWNFR